MANRPTPSDGTVKRSWLHPKLHFQLPERSRKQFPKPQRDPGEAYRHEVPAPHSNYITEPRKKPSRTENPQNSGSSERLNDWIASMGSGGCLDSPQAESIRGRNPPPIGLPQELRQSHLQTQDSQHLPPSQPSLSPKALKISKKRADYYDSLSPETCKTYGYPIIPPEFKIPRKPLQKFEYNLDEKIRVETGKILNFSRPQIIDIPLQANPLKPHLRAKKSSSQSSFRSRPPRAPSAMNSEGHTREFSDFEHFQPREHHESQPIIKESKHARPQIVTASEVQRYKSIAGSICHEPSRRSSMQFSETSHSRPGSSSMYLPADQFQMEQALNHGMFEEDYYRLDKQDRREEQDHQSSAISLRSEARSHKSRAAITPQSPGRIRRVEARPLPPTPQPRQWSEISVRSSAGSHKHRKPIIPKPSEDLRWLETGYLERKSISHTPHQPTAIPIPSSARPYTTRTPIIPNQSKTECPPRRPISHDPSAIPIQPPARSHRPPTPNIPKPPGITFQLEAKPSRPVPKTLQRRRGRPLQPPQTHSDKVKPRPPVPSSVSKVSL
ncbi:hypothetical protein EAE96_006488 [Botrytis aclada]|nr:hypothetical protein EAE96_006488 [Botrytis aclada]